MCFLHLQLTARLPYTLNFNSRTVYWHDRIQTSALAEDIWDVNNLSHPFLPLAALPSGNLCL